MDERTVHFYDRSATDLARRYESVTGGVERYFPLAFALTGKRMPA